MQDEVLDWSVNPANRSVLRRLGNLLSVAFVQDMIIYYLDIRRRRVVSGEALEAHYQLQEIAINQG